MKFDSSLRKLPVTQAAFGQAANTVFAYGGVSTISSWTILADVQLLASWCTAAPTLVCSENVFNLLSSAVDEAMPYKVQLAPLRSTDILYIPLAAAGQNPDDIGYIEVIRENSVDMVAAYPQFVKTAAPLVYGFTMRGAESHLHTGDLCNLMQWLDHRKNAGAPGAPIFKKLCKKAKLDDSQELFDLMAQLICKYKAVIRAKKGSLGPKDASMLDFESLARKMSDYFALACLAASATGGMYSADEIVTSGSAYAEPLPKPVMNDLGLAYPHALTFSKGQGGLIMNREHPFNSSTTLPETMVPVVLLIGHNPALYRASGRLRDLGPAVLATLLGFDLTKRTAYIRPSDLVRFRFDASETGSDIVIPFHLTSVAKPATAMELKKAKQYSSTILSNGLKVYSPNPGMVGSWAPDAYNTWNLRFRELTIGDIKQLISEHSYTVTKKVYDEMRKRLKPMFGSVAIEDETLTILASKLWSFKENASELTAYQAFGTPLVSRILASNADGVTGWPKIKRGLIDLLAEEGLHLDSMPAGYSTIITRSSYIWDIMLDDFSLDFDAWKAVVNFSDSVVERDVYGEFDGKTSKLDFSVLFRAECQVVADHKRIHLTYGIKLKDAYDGVPNEGGNDDRN
jgi:hypothetical protein